MESRRFISSHTLRILTIEFPPCAAFPPLACRKLTKNAAARLIFWLIPIPTRPKCNAGKAPRAIYALTTVAYLTNGRSKMASSRHRMANE